MLELSALAAIGYWGAQRGNSTVLKVTLAVLLPLIAAVYWGMFVAPKARFAGTRAVRLLLGLVVFGLASAALVHAGHTTLGWTFGAVTLVNTVLTYVGGPQPGETSP